LIKFFQQLKEAKRIISKLDRDLEEFRENFVVLNERIIKDLAEARNFIKKLTDLPGPSGAFPRLYNQNILSTITCRFLTVSFLVEF